MGETSVNEQVVDTQGASGDAPDATAPRRGRVSSRFLWFSMAVTLGVLVVGSCAMWGLFIAPDNGAPLASSEPAPSARTLVIGMARTSGGPGEWMTYARVVARMSRETGMDLRIRYIPDRREVIRLVSEGEVDAAFLCTYCYLQLERRDLVDAAARPLVGGSSSDAAVLVVGAASPYRRLSDLRGQSVAVSDGTSLGGYAFLYWLMDRSGLSARTFFSRVVHSTSQERNLVDLAAGRIDATVVNRSQLARWSTTTFRIVESSPEYGTPPFAVRRGLDDETRTKLREALLYAMDAPGISDGSSLSGFVAATPADYGFANQLLTFAAETTSAPSAGVTP